MVQPGSTTPWPKSLDLLDEQTGRRVVLALTDGEDTASESASLDTAIAAARRLGLPVYTLGLGTEEEIASGDLRRLATSTRAQYYPARNADQLKAIYETIAARIGAGYTLVYESDRRLPDGTLRPVRIFHRGSRSSRRDRRIHPRHGRPRGRLVALVPRPAHGARGPGAGSLVAEPRQACVGAGQGMPERPLPAGIALQDAIGRRGREGMETRAELKRWLRLVAAAIAAGLVIPALHDPARDWSDYLPRAIRDLSSGVVGRGAGRRFQGGPCLCRDPDGR